MAFKSMVQYNEEKYGNFFTLSNDGNYADVIFLYQSKNDVLIADVHYIKSAEYSGYAHCCGVGCPACAYPTQNGQGLRVDTKLFIPLYNITEGKIQFWDRSNKFEVQFANDVLNNFPNPSEYVFRVTRHGEAYSRDTRYEIKAVGKNTSMPYADILAKFGVTLPDYYSTVCRELSVAEMSSMLNANVSASSVAVPRDAYVPAPSMTIPTPTLNQNFDVPTNVPDLPEFNPEVPTEPVENTSEPSSDSSKDGSNADVDNVTF